MGLNRPRPRKVGRVLFDQGASRRVQVRIGTQTTRSIEDEDNDEDEDDYEVSSSSLLA